MADNKTPPVQGAPNQDVFDKWNDFVKKQKDSGMKEGVALAPGTMVPQFNGPPAPIADDAPKPPGSTDTAPPTTPDPIYPEKIGPVPQQPDPDHPDIYVPPNAAPGQPQEVLRWDKNVGSYCIIGSKNMSNSTPKDQWYMLDPKNYAGTNADFLKSDGANMAVPPKGPENHPDFSVPPDGDGVIMRWDDKAKKWSIVGETVNGKKVYFPNQSTAKMADNVNIPAFGGDGPRPPLPAPTKGTEPQWGGNADHPSFFGKNDQNDGKIYMWSWNSDLGRYTAVGEMADDGKGETAAKVYSLGDYRQKNSGPDGLRPDKNDLPAPLPTPDPYSAVDAPKSPPEVISILVPPDYKSAGDNKKMAKVTGEAVYRKDAATGKWVVVGVEVRGNPKADPPTDDQIYYFRPDDMQNFNPGGEPKKLEPMPASAAAPGPVPDLDKDKVTQALLDAIAEQEKNKGHFHPGDTKGSGSVTFTDSHGKQWTIKLGQPLTDDAKAALKDAGYY
jgi:hypothetical protein